VGNFRSGSELLDRSNSSVEERAPGDISPQVSVLQALGQSALQRFGGPLTQDRGLGSVGTTQPLSPPAPASARCAPKARPLGAGPLRLPRTTPVTCGITTPSTTGAIRISLVLGGSPKAKGEGNAERGRKRTPDPRSRSQGPAAWCGVCASALPFVPALGTENCKQSSCCCASCPLAVSVNGQLGTAQVSVFSSSCRSPANRE
jgi:hypothetical protein